MLKHTCVWVYLQYAGYSHLLFLLLICCQSFWLWRSVKVPQTLWAQRKDCVMLTIELADCKAPTIDLKNEGKLKFSGVGGTDKAVYELELEFYGPIVEEVHPGHLLAFFTELPRCQC